MSGYRLEFPEGTTERLTDLLKETKDAPVLRRIQTVYYRVAFNMKPKQIAEMVGFSVQTVRNLHSQYSKYGEVTLYLDDKGGRNHAYLTLEEENEFIGQFLKQATKGQILEVSEIHKAYEQKVSRKVCKSTIYKMLERHGWRKIAPRPRHPKASLEIQDDFKKNGRSSFMKPKKKPK